MEPNNTFESDFKSMNLEKEKKKWNIFDGFIIALAVLLFVLLPLYLCVPLFKEKAAIRKLEEVDFFSKVSISCTGVSGDAELEVVNGWTDEYLSGVIAYPSVVYHATNGETVTLSLDDYREPDRARSAGYKFKEMSKDYMITGLDEYYTDASEIDEASVTALQSIAADTVRDHIEARRGYFALMAEADPSYSGSISDSFSYWIDYSNEVFSEPYFHYSLSWLDESTPVYDSCYCAIVSVPVNFYAYRNGAADKIVSSYVGNLYFAVSFKNPYFSKSDQIARYAYSDVIACAHSYQDIYSLCTDLCK